MLAVYSEASAVNSKLALVKAGMNKVEGLKTPGNPEAERFTRVPREAILTTSKENVFLFPEQNSTFEGILRIASALGIEGVGVAEEVGETVGDGVAVGVAEGVADGVALGVGVTLNWQVFTITVGVLKTVELANTVIGKTPNEVPVAKIEA